MDRLAALLAREGLRQVAAGERYAMNGWLVYGAALNEGRKLFPSDREFGEWGHSSNLDDCHNGDRQAAMWAAADEEGFEATRKANPLVRTVRGSLS